MTIPEAFGNVLRQHREACGYSQQQLAHASGLDRTFLSRMESGKRQPTISTIFKLAEALNTSVSDLMEGVEEALQS
jgi:transcriptional regulator with XRE-family HTH domain